MMEIPEAWAPYIKLGSDGPLSEMSLPLIGIGKALQERGAGVTDPCYWAKHALNGDCSWLGQIEAAIERLPSGLCVYAPGYESGLFASDYIYPDATYWAQFFGADYLPLNNFDARFMPRFPARWLKQRVLMIAAMRFDIQGNDQGFVF